MIQATPGNERRFCLRKLNFWYLSKNLNPLIEIQDLLNGISSYKYQFGILIKWSWISIKGFRFLPKDQKFRLEGQEFWSKDQRFRSEDKDSEQKIKVSIKIPKIPTKDSDQIIQILGKFMKIPFQWLMILINFLKISIKRFKI